MLGPQLPAPSGQNSASDHLKGKARDGGAHRDSSKRGGSYLTSELWEKKLERLLRGTQEKKKKRQRGQWGKRLGQRQERNELVSGLIEKATEQVGQEFIILLLQTPKGWDYRYHTRPVL